MPPTGLMKTLPTAQTLADAGITPSEHDLRTLPRDHLVRLYGSRSGRIVLTRLFRALAWQIVSERRQGPQEASYGNLRSLWYSHAKPLLARLPDDDALATDPYDRLGEVFAELVMDKRLFSYADLGIVDENWENRRIGDRRPEIVVFAEKTGWVHWLRQVHAAWGVTTLALGGMPSAITSSYTAAHLLEVLDGPRPRVKLIGVVDYDPAGRAIAAAFQHQLGQAGLTDTELETVIHPRHYTDAQLDLFAYELSRRQPSHNATWLEATGGVRGRALGLEADSLPKPKVTELVGRLIDRDTAPPQRSGIT